MKHDPIDYTLPNGKVISLQYLYKEELDILLKVPTTVEQATRIILRNQPLIDAVNAGTTYHGKVGCPHCHYNYPCRSCVWQESLDKVWNDGWEIYNDSVYQVCCRVYFSGFQYTNQEVQALLTYGSDIENIWRGKINSAIDAIKDANDVRDQESWDKNYEEYRDIVLCFLHGHIEWANAVWILNGVGVTI